MSVGTNSGPVEVSTAPDGHETRTKSETVNADGSTTVTTTGSGANGVAVDTMAEGRASYSVDGSGNFQTTLIAQIILSRQKQPERVERIVANISIFFKIHKG